MSPRLMASRRATSSECTVGSHIAHGGESGLEHHSRIGHGLKRDLRSGLLKLRNRIAVVRAIGEVRVAIDQSGQHGHLGEIDDRGVRRELSIPFPTFSILVSRMRMI